MKLQYLGTAAAEGTPGIFCQCDLCVEAIKRGGKDIRTRSQAVMDDRLLIDFPPDSYWHMIRHGLNLPAMEHALITHTHEDHLYLNELFYRCKGFCDTRSHLTLYGNDALVRQVAIYLQQNHLTEDAARLSVVELTAFVPARLAGYTVTPLLAAHAKNEKCFIYIIEKEGKRLLYGNDTGIFPEATWRYIKGLRFDLISLDCTHGKDREGSNHMGVPDLIDIKQRLTREGNADKDTVFVATHFSHNGGLLHHQLEEALHPHGYLAAYDGMSVQV